MKIKFEDVSFCYEKNNNVLKHINLELNNNEIVFILGATGSGKSTLVSHMNGLLFANKGNVIVNDDIKEYNVTNKLKNIKDLRRSIGMVFQIPENQIFENTVIKEVMFGPLNFGANEEGAKTSGVEALELLSIDESFHNKSPFKLSGGEKRKVAIASVLACKPKVLVFDEPTSSLDKKSTRDFFKIVNKLKENGNMIVIISHNEDLAYEYADRIIIMNNGSITYDGDYDNAFSDDNILLEAKIEKPFVYRMKERLGITSNVRTVKELANELRGDTL